MAIISLKQAQDIMGRSYVGPTDIEKSLPLFACDQKYLQRIYPIPFSQETLQKHRRTHILIFDLGWSIKKLRRQVWQVRPDEIFANIAPAKPWYQRELFFNLSARPQWRLIRKQAVPRSLNQSFATQSQFLWGSGEYVPEAREVVFLMVAYYLKTRERLFPNYFVRTNSSFKIVRVIPRTYCVKVGHFRRFLEIQFESLIETYQSFTDVGLITACYSNLQL
ncbi:MAG TPA: hypothetical protein PLX73_00445 [Candidatus Paceibacterota bacterium]|nr:hypothetical protein [Candidatus Paceibacterota bacterium]HOL53748.1 hypothetical protein [Candidatus Paceibacterota bacterium]HON22043.1 hypothetical protein [Candidatus Paceibacterota bacterium]HPP16852.1 hypothetical protein [Candidatus Paceibacterota bacterium]